MVSTSFSEALVWYMSISWATSFLHSVLFSLSYVSLFRVDQPRNWVRDYGDQRKCLKCLDEVDLLLKYGQDQTEKESSHTSVICSSFSSKGLTSFLLKKVATPTISSFLLTIGRARTFLIFHPVSSTPSFCQIQYPDYTSSVQAAIKRSE